MNAKYVLNSVRMGFICRRDEQGVVIVVGCMSEEITRFIAPEM